MNSNQYYQATYNDAAGFAQQDRTTIPGSDQATDQPYFQQRGAPLRDDFSAMTMSAQQAPPPYSQYQQSPAGYGHHIHNVPNSRLRASQGHSIETRPSAISPSLATSKLPRSTSLPGQLLPVVLPQTTKAFRGAFYSPFVRAWAPQLAEHGISQADFLTFIDGLNECWVANPALEGVGLAGLVMQQFHGTPIIQLVGTGVQVAAGFGSAATSIARSKMYFKAINADLFHPVGLQAKICSTKDMMVEIGHSEQELKLLPLDTNDQLDSEAVTAEAASNSDASISPEDSRMRRMRALQGYVAPLDFNVPAVVEPDNMLKRMGNAQAQRMAKKQQEKEVKEREKAVKEHKKKTKEGGKDINKAREKVEEVEEKLQKEKDKMDRKLSKKAGDAKEQEKIRKDFEKEERKLEKDLAKEQSKYEKEVAKQGKEGEKREKKPQDKEEKATQKIRWVVITQWDGDEDEDDVSEEA